MKTSWTYVLWTERIPAGNLSDDVTSALILSIRQLCSRCPISNRRIILHRTSPGLPDKNHVIWPWSDSRSEYDVGTPRSSSHVPLGWRREFEPGVLVQCPGGEIMIRGRSGISSIRLGRSVARTSTDAPGERISLPHRHISPERNQSNGASHHVDSQGPVKLGMQATATLPCGP